MPSGIHVIERLEDHRAIERDRLAASRHPSLPHCRGDEPTVWISFACGIPELVILRSREVDPERIARWAARSLGLKHGAAGGDRFVAPLDWTPPYERVIDGIALRSNGDAGAWGRMGGSRKMRTSAMALCAALAIALSAGAAMAEDDVGGGVGSSGSGHGGGTGPGGYATAHGTCNGGCASYYELAEGQESTAGSNTLGGFMDSIGLGGLADSLGW